MRDCYFYSNSDPRQQLAAGYPIAVSSTAPSEKADNGRRYYSEEDLITLEKITLLKSLSLPLEDIQQLLDKLSYKHILIAHYNHLQQQLAALETSIANTTSLINMIDLEGTISWERVSHLVQQAKTTTSSWMDYFEDDEQQLLQQILPRLNHHDKATQKYVSLLRQIEWCIEHSIAPESEEGARIANELIALSDETFKGDEELMNKFWEVRKRPSEETGLYPVSEEVLAFVERSMLCVTQQDG
ncbi:MerR family transcriptional regulator [Paenibacillus aquistagni]|uniref:MerR HTH family regulatory protein n=1 Tax=Paenibacillus aquistagni TaxID=1852522 RepID=A0A1X7J2L0_9BACL|nr:MerR family transcriptional regulator [Paenibacillus aquistagni]SMG21814.1 MerR HTH family regulatory protein [Paenibacillus aquistagni]